MTSITTSEWFARMPARSSPGHVRMFCFPHAGGGTALFSDLAASLPPGIEIYAARLPGREARVAEPLIDDLGLLVDQLALAISPYLDIPFAFLGHSMGALIAWELARALRRSSGLAPRHLFVAASRAPSRSGADYARAATFSDQEIAAFLNEANGTPAEVLANPELMSLVARVIRADFRMLADYTYESGEPVECPITVFSGDADPLIPVHELSDWAENTRGGLEIKVVRGNHFLIDSGSASRREIFALIAACLCPEAGGRGGAA